MRRLRTGLTLVLLLVIPMLYSPIANLWILRTGIWIAGLEWLLSGASVLGLLVWFLPAAVAVQEAMDGWPGRFVALETLWIVLIYSDSAQLLVGRRFGRRKAFPSVSPNKSIEGYVGGLAIAFLLARYVHGWTAVPTMVVLVAGCVGDLYFSFFKRRANLKDFSNMLGPHGGICDRIDSFVFAVLALFVWGHLAGEEVRTDFLQSRYLSAS